jgi:hypothetical protein
VNAGSRTVPPDSSPEPAAIRGASTPENSGRVEHQKLSPLELWLYRIRALLLVTVCASFGVLLIILPWTPKWTDTPFLLAAPTLRNVVSAGFVRGVATGLGILDLWVGFWEAIHYHEAPKVHR